MNEDVILAAKHMVEFWEEQQLEAVRNERGRLHNFDLRSFDEGVLQGKSEGLTEFFKSQGIVI